MKEGERVSADLYEAAGELFSAKVTRFKQTGWLIEPEEGAGEEAVDDYFDTLIGIYREACAELGLPWPPLLEEGAYEIE